MNLSARPGERPYLRAMALTSAFSFLWVVIEHIGARIQVSPYQVVWTRYASHLVLLLLLFGPFRGGVVRTTRLRLQVFASLLMLGMPLCFIASIRRMPVREAMVIFWVAPLMVAAASGLLHWERTGPGSLLATVSASAGAVLVSGPHVSLLRFAAVLPVGMAACFAGYLLTLRALAGEPIIPKLVHTALWVFLPLTLALPLFWKMPSSTDLIAMSSIGIIGCAALFLLDRALEMAPPMIIAPAVCTQPVWAEILEGRRPTPLTLLGLVFILSAIAAVALWRPAGVPRGAAAAAGTGA